MLLAQRVNLKQYESLGIGLPVARPAYQYGLIFKAEVQERLARLDNRAALRLHDHAAIVNIAQLGSEALNLIVAAARAVGGADVVDWPSSEQAVRDAADFARAPIHEHVIDRLQEQDIAPLVVRHVLRQEPPLPVTTQEPSLREQYEEEMDQEIRPHGLYVFAPEDHDRADAWYAAAVDVVALCVHGFPVDQLDAESIRAKRRLVGPEDPLSGLIASLKIRLDHLDRLAERSSGSPPLDL